MLEIGTESDRHTAGVITRRSNAETKDQCHNIFERPARLRKLAQETVAGLLGGGQIQLEAWLITRVMTF
jgi:hypothetical protein